MAEKKAFLDPKAFVNGANDTPIPQPPASRAAPPTESAPIPAKPAAKPSRAANRPDWSSAHPKHKVAFSARLSELTHMQLKYLSEVSPDSMHTIVMDGIEREVARRLRELGISA